MNEKTVKKLTPEGKIRPPIDAPHLVAEQVGEPTSVDKKLILLTVYRFCDTSEYTHRVFDYRLRWTFEARHSSMDADGRGTRGWARAHVEVWSIRDAEWHFVWELSRTATSPYDRCRWEVKARDWNSLLDELAEYATDTLL
jgi:hypothetical protein